MLSFEQRDHKVSKSYIAYPGDKREKLCFLCCDLKSCDCLFFLLGSTPGRPRSNHHVGYVEHLLRKTIAKSRSESSRGTFNACSWLFPWLETSGPSEKLFGQSAVDWSLTGSLKSMITLAGVGIDADWSRGSAVWGPRPRSIVCYLVYLDSHCSSPTHRVTSTPSWTRRLALLKTIAALN